MPALRCAELGRFFSDKYGETLPPDDAGRDDAWIMANILARTKGGEREIRRWLASRAPWMAGKDVDQIAADAMRLRLKWTADKLAQCIGLTFEVRDRLGITTIGACDMTKAERETVRKARMRKARADKRRANGLKPRAEYEAAAAGHGKPWWPKASAGLHGTDANAQPRETAIPICCRQTVSSGRETVWEQHICLYCCRQTVSTERAAMLPYRGNDRGVWIETRVDCPEQCGRCSGSEKFQPAKKYEKLNV
jgi:hypothetical protein